MSLPFTALCAFLAAESSHKMMAFFMHFGLFGLFLISIVDSSFVPLPIPGVTDIMLVVYAAAHANIFLLVIIATIGSAIGGFFSHAVGQVGGMAFLQKHVKPAILARATKWVEEHALLSVALPAILPPPMPLSAFVLVAGAVHMSRRKFMTAFTISRFARHLIAVWLGVRYGKHVLHIWAQFSNRWGATILIVLWSVIIAFSAIGIWQLYRVSKEMNLPGKLVGGKRLTETLTN